MKKVTKLIFQTGLSLLVIVSVFSANKAFETKAEHIKNLGDSFINPFHFLLIGFIAFLLFMLISKSK